MNKTNTITLVNDLFYDGQKVRSALVGGKPMFCGIDIARILGYARPADAVSAHCKGGSILPTPSAGGTQQTKFIGEADVYRLILRSKAPKAEAFQDWLCEEVLPSLRAKGYYIRPGLSDCDRRLKAAQLEVCALEYELAAKRTRLEKVAVLANELPGSVPVGALVHDMHPTWSQPKQASLCSRIVAAAEKAQKPVGHTRVGHGRVRTMRPEDFAHIFATMHLLTQSQGEELIIESGTATLKTDAIQAYQAEHNDGSEIAD